MPLSQTEENYLKAIYKLSESDKKAVNTNAIAKLMQTSAASVTDMIKRLSEKKVIDYKKYHGVELTQDGITLATGLVRKHRLWETFLVDRLNFSWEEVHDIAEQLEHIQSDKLVNRLDEYLGHPKFDPHGDPIPSADGKFTLRNQYSLSELSIGEQGQVIGVKTHETPFLEHLNDLGIKLNSAIQVIDKKDYDNSTTIRIEDASHVLSEKVANKILLKKL